MEYSQVFDIVKFEKEIGIARFNLFREVSKLRDFFEALVVLGLISWSTARLPALVQTATGHVIRFSTYLFNHHVVFLIGNAIIVLLFVLCRRNNAVRQSGDDDGGGDLYNDYLRNSETPASGEPILAPQTETVYGPHVEKEGGGCGGDKEKQIIICGEEAVGIPQSDDVTVAIEKAAKQIKRFQRTQSEKLRREIGVGARTELRRSESQTSQKRVSSGKQFVAVDMERLSCEEFRQRVDAFIDKHWSKKKAMKQNRFQE